LLTYEVGHTILFTRYTLTSAHISIIPEFIDKIETLDLYNDFYITKDEIVNTKTGSKILFKGIKTSSGTQTANLKSLAGVTTWVLDEAEELTDEDTFDKIDFSIRTKGIQNRVILILNPTTKEHFIYKRFFENRGVKDGVTLSNEYATYIHTTFEDNIENLSESFIAQAREMETNNPKKYNHVILGGWLDKAEGVVFENWEFGEFNPDKLQTSFGQDFGFSIDPTTLVEVAIDKTKKVIYIKEHLYKPKLTTSEIATININRAGKSLIIADSAEPRLIDELRKQGCNIIPTQKGQGSISAGVALMQDYKLIISHESVNIAKELNNYVYADKQSKLFVDDFNHCFTGDTLITTINGQTRIDEIKIGDLVLTSQGYKKVLKTFNNGVKKVNRYSMQLDTFFVFLCSTKEHKIKTTKGWKQISQLQNQDSLFLYNGLTEKITNSIKTKDILVEEQKDYIQKFGNITKEKSQKDTMCIMLMAILLITTYQILIWLIGVYILGLRVKKDLKKTLNGLNNFILKALRVQKSGISQNKEKNGIANTAKKHGLIENIKNAFVKFVVKSTKQDTQEYLNTAIKTAKLKHFDKKESYNAQVYDLMVEDCHEYFANGILVHNCIDAIRYNVFYQLSKGSAPTIR
jgi:phage terminase large subunit